MVRYQENRQRNAKKPWLSIALLVGFLVAVVSWYSLFRPVSVVDFQGASIEVERSWGRPVFLRIDRNSDGVVDYEAVPRASSNESNVLVIPPREFWSDEDYDGSMDLHVVLGEDTERPARLFEVDADSDGTPERTLSGIEADLAYVGWLEKNATDPEEGPKSKN